MSKKRILGIDPGTAVSGFGVIDVLHGRYSAVDFGCIRPPSKYNLSDRYLIISNGLDELIERFSPDAVVVETQYVQHNVTSAMKIGMARGLVLVAARRKGIEVFEYAPSRAKQSVTGTGRASKHQVQGMVQKLLCLPTLPQPEDAADALALAICHAQTPAYKLKPL